MTTTLLSEKVRQQIDHWLQRYPAEQKQSGVLQALMFAQEDNQGFLSEPLMAAVADYLQMPKIAVYEVASFYSLYHLKPVGRHVINVCTNISCMLNGSEQILAHLKNRLKIDVDETTQDQKFTLKEVECLAACTGAPMFQIGKKYYECLTPDKVDNILDELE